MTIKEIINFIYYLEDKIDPVFHDEIRKSVNNFVKKLEKNLINL